MSLIVPKPQQNLENLVPSGNHLARLYSIIHLGTTNEETQWGIKDINKVWLTFELCNEKKEFREGEGEKPFSISQEYTLSLNEKANLRKVVEGMLGAQLKEHEAEAFDIEELIGRACMVQVTHKEAKNGNTYANITAVTEVPKGMPIPDLVNKTRILNYTDKWSESEYNALPEFLQRKMVDTYEFKAMERAKTGEERIDPDDIPF